MLTVMRIDRWDPRRDGPVTEAALRHAGVLEQPEQFVQALAGFLADGAAR